MGNIGLLLNKNLNIIPSEMIMLKPIKIKYIKNKMF